MRCLLAVRVAQVRRPDLDNLREPECAGEGAELAVVFAVGAGRPGLVAPSVAVRRGGGPCVRRAEPKPCEQQRQRHHQAADTVDGERGEAIHDRAQRRQLAQVELARLVGSDVGHHRNAVTGQAGKRRIGGYDGGRPCTTAGQVVHVGRHEHGPAAILASFHASRMPDR
jgi:hypothetical protein